MYSSKTDPFANIDHETVRHKQRPWHSDSVITLEENMRKADVRISRRRLRRHWRCQIQENKNYSTSENDPPSHNWLSIFVWRSYIHMGCIFAWSQCLSPRFRFLRESYFSQLIYDCMTIFAKIISLSSCIYITEMSPFQ